MDFSGFALSKTVDTTDGSGKSEPTPFSSVSPVAPINAGALRTDISVFLDSPTGPVKSTRRRVALALSFNGQTAE